MLSDNTRISKPTGEDIDKNIDDIFKVDYSGYFILGIMVTFISGMFVIPMNLIYLNNGWFEFNTQRDTMMSLMILSGLIMPTLTGLWSVMIYRKMKE